MNNFPSLNNKYYVIGQDFCNLEKCEGTTKDGKKIYILKDDFVSLPYEVKEAFRNLSNLNLCDFEYFTLTPAERKKHPNVNKVKLDEEISKFRRKENLLQLHSILRPDILKILISFLSINTKEVFSLTCQHFKEAVGKTYLEKICKHAAREGHLEVLKWARKNGAPWNGPICSEAAKGGHLEVLKWAYANSAPGWDKQVCSQAAEKGHLEILKWALANGANYAHLSKRICSKAVEGGHLEVLKWARTNGAPWDEWVCLEAAKEGHFEILRWARENNAPWDKWVCTYAALNGHLEMLKWARANGAPWDDLACAYAADGDHLEVLKWARENGAPWDIDLIRDFARSNIIKWLDENP